MSARFRGGAGLVVLLPSGEGQAHNVPSPPGRGRGGVRATPNLAPPVVRLKPRFALRGDRVRGAGRAARIFSSTPVVSWRTSLFQNLRTLKPLLPTRLCVGYLPRQPQRVALHPPRSRAEPSDRRNPGCTGQSELACGRDNHRSATGGAATRGRLPHRSSDCEGGGREDQNPFELPRLPRDIYPES